MGDVLSLPTLEVSRVLGCDDELVADATPLDPLANEGLGSLVLAVLASMRSRVQTLRGEYSLIVCSVDEVALAEWVSTHA